MDYSINRSGLFVAANKILKSAGWGQLVNADVDSAAAIAASKLAAGGTANRVVATADGTTMAMQQIATGMVAANAITQVQHVVGSTSGPTTSSGTGTTLAEMTITMTTTGGPVLILFSGTFQNSTVGLEVVTDLVHVSVGSLLRRQVTAPVANYNCNISWMWLLTSSTVGSNTWRVEWLVNGGTALSVTTQRSFAVIELKR